MEEKYLTVTQINNYINRKLKSDDVLKSVYIRGELSNYKTYPSGHSYFTLKDKNSQIRGVMFKGNKRFLKFEPKNGMKVIIKGKIEVYEKNGNYQLYAQRITEDGIGELHIAYEQLKKKLEKEGLFDKSHKQEIPKYPKRIGVITAQTGAAIRDIITTIKRRWSDCEIYIFSTLVQGDLAAPQIVRQIKNAQNYDLDTLIIGRGGGSIEDLWPFNEEIVARALYDCKIPTISAVGHEIDYAITDFVADLRAPTPTAAAELVVPEKREIEFKVSQLNKRITNNVREKLTTNKLKLDNISQKQIFKNPESIYEIKEMNLDNIINRLEFSSKNIISQNRTKLMKIENSVILKNPSEITKEKRDAYLKNFNKLEVLNPLLTLKRGYTLTKKDGKIISSSKDVKKDDELEIEFDDGKINTKVI